MESKMQFSALDPVQVVLPSIGEKIVRGKDYVSWGDDNNAPQYLSNLVDNVATLQAIIRATVDFALGSSVIAHFTLPGLPEGVINKQGDTLESLVKKLLYDKCTFGGYAYQVVRNLAGDVAELFYLDVRGVRSSKKTTGSDALIFFADDWGWGTKAICLPSYKEGLPSSVIFERGDLTKGTYPKPPFVAALKACETERRIDNWHLNNIQNGFSSNVIISFNDGKPDDEQRGEIEKKIQEKFSGDENSGRVMLCFNDSKDNAVTIEKLDDDKADEKYLQLVKRTRETIFTAFGMPPQLVGLNPEDTGFSNIEYSEAFKLYNQTRIQPLQKELIRSFEKVFGEGCVEIQPFNLNHNE